MSGRRALTEHAWLRRVTRRLRTTGPMVRVGPGDDAAALRLGGATLLVTTDALVEGVHFRSGWLSPRALGARAYAVNASDIAAMGGRPLAAVLALEVPRGTRSSTLDGLVDAFAAAARRHGAVLVGGNVARGRQLAAVATLLGIAGPRLVTRAGARPGDAVFVTGTLGATAAAVRARRAGRTIPLPRVPDRVRAGALVARVASAMIDVSDGLAQDVGHLCRASRVAAWLDGASIPLAAACRRLVGRSALAVAVTGGEDYELCFTVPPSALARLAALEPRLGCRVTRIGRIERGRPRVRIVDTAGDPIPLARAGFDHLRA